MADNNQTSTQADNKDAKPPFWRRRLVPLSLGLLAVVLLLMPWSASVGNYGALSAVPQQETILRAPESATLVALRVQPVAGNSTIIVCEACVGSATTRWMSESSSIFIARSRTLTR